MQLQSVIGLEIHVHLNTKSKLFCGCKNVSDASEPNLYICPVCMGFPGTLPVLNRAAVVAAIKVGLALQCHITEYTQFARKSYFYPDLPKGYQISQYEHPICSDGLVHVTEDGKGHDIRIERAHLEEDAAKSVHEGRRGTFIDHNRAGTPLVEIVTAPDIQSPQQAKLFLEDLQRTIRALGVSNADMECGDLRVDANISLRDGDDFHPKTEIKNLNSFRAVERALRYEIERQTKLWESGDPPNTQSTRGWDDSRQVTVGQRVKEEEADYRYFPEPDIPPLSIDPEYVRQLQCMVPELPRDKEQRFCQDYHLPLEQARLIVSDEDLASYAEQVFSEILAWSKSRTDVLPRSVPEIYRLATSYLLGDFRKMLANLDVSVRDTKADSENFAELMVMLHRAEVNRNAVPEVLRSMHETGGDPSEIVRDKGLAQVSDEAKLQRTVQDVIASHPAEADKVRAGKVATIRFLMGRVMAETRGTANPEKVEELLKKELGVE